MWRRLKSAAAAALISVSLCLVATTSQSQETDSLPAHAPLEPGDTRDKTGLWKDTKYFLGYQVATIGVLYAMPESVSGWSDDQKDDYSLSIWWDNVTSPQMDSDDFYLNYVLHPYWGAAYFVRARERGYDNWESFRYATLLSCMYEFGVEALFEEASIQDLVVTPVVGSLLGRHFWNVRTNIRSRDSERGYRSTGDKWLWALTDPLGSINRQVDKMLGYETQLQIRPFRLPEQRNAWQPGFTATADREPVYGFEIQIRWK